MKTISIIGAGTMGQGISYTAATSGFNVILHDSNQEQLHNAKLKIKALLEKSVDKGFLNQEVADTAQKNFNFEEDFTIAASNADLAIEAVFEDMKLKLDIFSQLDQFCPSHTILATNTSTMSPTEIASITKRPDQCLAMHFFNPVHKMKLIEIVRGLDTSDQTFSIAKTFGEQMGKEIVEVNEFPGFVTSRMNCLIGNEAMKMLTEGVASAVDIDKAIRLGLNHPMGPLELADLVGLDSRLRNMEYLHKTLGEAYRPAPILTKYVKANRLGRKNGKGFFNY